MAKSKVVKPRGIVNFKNNCYANATLQAILPLTEFWKEMPSDKVIKFPLLKALRETLSSLLEGAVDPFKPYSFLAKLGSFIAKATSRPFNVQACHDPCDILSHLFELMITSNCMPAIKIEVAISKKTSCPCGIVSKEEDKSRIFVIPLAANVQRSIDLWMQQRTVDHRCHFCSKWTKANQVKSFSSLPEILFLQLERVKRVNGTLKRDESPIFCHKLVRIHTKIPTSSSPKITSYRLVSSLCHKGSMNSGHYTATIVD